MRAKSVNFEKTGDPLKTMKVGSHRELTGQQLIDTIFDNLYSELKDDPRFEKEDPIVFKDDLYGWILAMTDDPDTGESLTMSPDDIPADLYREYWDEIHLEDEEPTFMGL